MSTTERNTVAEPGTMTRDDRRIIRRHIELATATNPEGVVAAIALVGLWGAMLGGLVVYAWMVIA